MPNCDAALDKRPALSYREHRRDRGRALVFDFTRELTTRHGEFYVVPGKIDYTDCSEDSVYLRAIMHELAHDGSVVGLRVCHYRLEVQLKPGADADIVSARIAAAIKGLGYQVIAE